MNQRVRNGGLADWWWLGVIVGMVTLLFGIAVLFWPGLTLVTFAYLFSAYVLVWGILSVVTSLVNIGGFTGMWWLTIVFGVFALGVGVYLVRNPDVSFTTLVSLVGATLIVKGIFDVVEGLFSDGSATGKAMTVVAGAVAVIAGILMLVQPADAGVAFVWILGLFGLVFGSLQLAAAMDERNLAG